MTDQSWLFSYGSIVIVFVTIFVLGGVAYAIELLWSRLSESARSLIGGTLIIAFIAYVVIGIAYAVLNPKPVPEFYDDVPREWIR